MAWWKAEDGQAMVEYALILVLVTLAVAGAGSFLGIGPSLNEIFGKIEACLSDPTTGC
jgi:Flp pilus assembly pilin Flp